MNLPLFLTTLTASSKEIISELTKAVYSPKLSPAVKSHDKSNSFLRTFKIAVLTVRIAGCVFSVSIS